MSTRIGYLARLLPKILLFFALLFFLSTVMALDVEHVCGKQVQLDKTKAPSIGWTTGTGNVYPKQPCWLRFPYELGDAKLLSFKAVWIDINLYDANGKLLANAIHLGEKNQAIVSANRISFLTSNATFPLYARLDVSPSTSYFDQVEVESLGLNEAMHLAQTFDSISVAQTAILIGFAVIAAAFGLLLRNLTYALFALFCFFRAAFLIFNNGLIFSLWDIPDWLPQLFILTSWPSNAIQSVLVTRMSGFAEHSPKLHYSMLVMALFYLCLIPIDIYIPYQSLVLQDYLDMIWYPVAIFGVGRAVFLKRAGSAILFLGLIPMAIFWWPLAVAQLLPRSFGLSFETPSGTTLDIIQNLFFPTLFFLSLAFRALQLDRDAIRIAQSAKIKLEATVIQRTQELIVKNKQLEELSITDRLTGLYNRLYLDRTLEREFASVARSKRTFAIILLDIDKFKQINDSFGHHIGDAVLIAFAQILKTRARVTDAAGRWGGEEFLIICPDTDISDAIAVAEVFRQQIEQFNFQNVSRCTASFGVSAYTQGDTISTMEMRADKALYAAKENGRNRVMSEFASK